VRVTSEVVTATPNGMPSQLIDDYVGFCQSGFDQVFIAACQVEGSPIQSASTNRSSRSKRRIRISTFPPLQGVVAPFGQTARRTLHP